MNKNTLALILIISICASLFFLSCAKINPVGAPPIIPIPGKLMDVDGNAYDTITIGKQVWTVENFRATKYNDGTTIPLVTDPTTWNDLATPAYSYYNNTTNRDSIIKFGALYNWFVVESRNFAPKGWHVPSNADWDSLLNFLIANDYNYDGTTTGNKVAKSMAATMDWQNNVIDSGAVGNNLSLNNKSGFSALPSGARFPNGGFHYLDQQCYWWSTTAEVGSFNEVAPYHCNLYSDKNKLIRYRVNDR
jgi:uncharacterized protein (TIGR02145 family)